jgi:alkanesulfonate monooxygenase SsuD/methylene tetrahydromethanopterin reductase-like flavin-dependent oxidoreductase (luciferase family)
MRHAIDIAPLAELADPRAIVRLAVAAERAGWDGLSIWDSLGTSMSTEAADPWVALAAVASATDRLRLILSVVALPRRRAQLVAQAAATLDSWSRGRFVLGLGAGGDPGDFTQFGESFDANERIAALDDGAGRIDTYLRGTGNVRVGPRPIQLPRPPVWIGGMRPGALRRAARWDGWVAIAVADDGSGMNLSAEAFGEMVARVRAERESLGRAGEPFDVAVFALSEPDDEALRTGFESAGATWWLESLSPLRGSIDDLLVRIEAGPSARG